MNLFDKVFKRLEAFRRVEEILYVSLTWNHENRFGGGNKILFDTSNTESL